jgi:hypothetical protein
MMTGRKSALARSWQEENATFESLDDVMLFDFHDFTTHQQFRIKCQTSLWLFFQRIIVERLVNLAWIR